MATETAQRAAAARGLRARAGALGERDTALLLAAGIALAYLVTRLVLVWRFPPFLDEAWHADWVSEVASGESGAFVSFEIGKEPMVVWLGYLWTKLGVEPLTAVRLVSVTAGLVTLASVGMIGRELGGNRVGLVAAGLYVVLPFTAVHDVIGIADPLVIAGFSAALYLQIRLVERPRLDFALLAGAAMAVALLSKESGKLALLFLPITFVCLAAGDRDRWRRLLRWLPYAAAAAAVAGAGYLVMRLSGEWDTLLEVRRNPVMYPVRSLDDVLGDPFALTPDNWSVFSDALVSYLTVPLLAAFAVGGVLAFRARRGLAILLAAAVVIPFVTALLAAPLAFPRYVLYVVPAFTVLAAYGVVQVTERVLRASDAEGVRLALAVGIFLVLLPAVLFDARVIADPNETEYPSKDDEQYVTGWAAGTGWEPLAAEVEKRLGDRPAVLVYSTGFNDVLGLLLDEHDIAYRPSDHPDAARADFLVQNEANFPDPTFEALTPQFRLVWEYHRPRGGAAMRLFEAR